MSNYPDDVHQNNYDNDPRSPFYMPTMEDELYCSGTDFLAARLTADLFLEENDDDLSEFDMLYAVDNPAAGDARLSVRQDAPEPEDVTHAQELIIDALDDIVRVLSRGLKVPQKNLVRVLEVAYHP